MGITDHLPASPYLQEESSPVTKSNYRLRQNDLMLYIRYLESVLLDTVLLLLRGFSRVRLCNPIDGSPPDTPVPGILQARTLEWVAVTFSKA